jgi:hypothetical protein
VFRAGYSNPENALGKRKGASQKACAKLYLYFQPIRFRGVNPPSFQIYFFRRIMDLAGIGRLRGLDKILRKISFCTVLGAIKLWKDMNEDRGRPTRSRGTCLWLGAAKRDWLVDGNN